MGINKQSKDPNRVFFCYNKKQIRRQRAEADGSIALRTNLFKSKIHVAVAILAAACIGAFAVFVFAEGPPVITEKVTGLELIQDGTAINITWDDMECDGYDLTYTCEGRTTPVYDIETNTYTIEDVALNKYYSVTVSAKLRSGYNSREADAEIFTEKLKQKIKVNTDSFDGFKGDTFTIKASGFGDISFEAGSKKTASVNDKGKVKLKKSGHTDITVQASGDGLHQSGSKKIRVNVYPKTLAEPGRISAENISDTRVKIKWDPVDFASSYSVLKKNAATGKFEEAAESDGDGNYVEITRDAGSYAVKAHATVHETRIDGRLSKSVEVTGCADGAKTYSSAHNIGSLNESNLELVRVINGDGGTRVPQSLTLKDGNYVVAYVNHGGTEGKFITYSSSGECIDIVSASGMGHANGSAYNPNTDKFYVVKTHKNIKSATCSTYSGDTKASEGSFELPRVTSGIAYDISSNKYYLSKGNEIYVCSSEFEVEKFIHKSARYDHAQDIGAYNGVVLVCTWVSGNTSYIDMYRASDGGYLGSYDVSIGEIESCVVDDGYLVILMNTIGSSKDRIYRTKERIAIP